MKKTWKQKMAVLAAGVMAFSMTGCADLTSKLTGLFGGGSKAPSSADWTTEDPTGTGIVLKNVTKAKNVILMIGDGMGPEQINAGALFKDGHLNMQRFPYKTTVETRSDSAVITDSAAAATAIATGVRTTNGIVGKFEGEDLTTIVDIAAGLGKRTGVIATEELYGATPMGFSGHADARGDSVSLLKSASTNSNVNFFASSVISKGDIGYFTDAGYKEVRVVDDISEETSDKVIGSYNINPTAESMSSRGSITSFDRLVTEALEYLSQDEDGFFLMAEGSHIDHGGHNNDIAYMLEELISFDEAVGAVLEWAKDRDDTVVIVTADHETGGLQLLRGATHEDIVNAYIGEKGAYSWTSGSHTATDVNIYINGADIDFSKYAIDNNNRIKNTDVFEIMKSLIE